MLLCAGVLIVSANALLAQRAMTTKPTTFRFRRQEKDKRVTLTSSNSPRGQVNVSLDNVGLKTKNKTWDTAYE